MHAMSKINTARLERHEKITTTTDQAAKFTKVSSYELRLRQINNYVAQMIL